MRDRAHKPLPLDKGACMTCWLGTCTAHREGEESTLQMSTFHTDNLLGTDPSVCTSADTRSEKQHHHQAKTNNRKVRHCLPPSLTRSDRYSLCLRLYLKSSTCTPHLGGHMAETNSSCVPLFGG